jgi:hypothetical protein
LQRLRRLLGRGLERTAALWPEVRRAYRWGHAAARIFDNQAGLGAEQVEARYDRLLKAWAARRDQAGTLAEAVDRFLKVTESYRPGLFHGYRILDLPRTNNALEQFFGAYRHHERRATGRKVASPTLVLRGSVRLTAAALTRLGLITIDDLAAVDLVQWHDLRRRLQRRHHARLLRSRFRRNPQAFLADLERLALQPALPP